MPDVTADIKTRYSIYVPKPLARINFGDWQKRDGANFSPKFGYSGVSVQTDQNLFVDVVKTTYMQMRGSFVAHASDWLQCSLKPMVLATADNATIGADGTATVVAGAGQAPTWTLDHGDALETVPYINLQLHYRVEEVQNSLFEFFRGRREKDDPFRKMNFKGKGFLRGWEIFTKKEVAFDSSLPGPLGALTKRLPGFMQPKPPMGAKEGAWEGDQWKAPDKKLAGGFELLVERSWQELYGKADWDYDVHEMKDGKKVLKKFAPNDIFGGLKDIRLDPDPNAITRNPGNPLSGKAALKDDIDGNEGKLTERMLMYGFSGYFSRFDPYLMLDPEAVDADTKLSSFEKKWIVKPLVHANNFVTKLKRHVDVMYKMATFLRDNALMKVVKDAAAAVDSANQAVKAVRGNCEMLAAMILQNRGWWGEQMADEMLSGLGKRGYAFDKVWAADVVTKAVVRSIAPYKDPTKAALTMDQQKDKAANQDADPNKGFYGGNQKFGGGYILPGGTQLKDNDRIRIKAKKKDGTEVEFDTPPLRINTATSAELTGIEMTAKAKFKPGSKLLVQLDSGAWREVDVTASLPAPPAVSSSAIPASMFVTSTGLYQKTLTLTTDGGAPVSLVLNETNAPDEATFLQTLKSTFNTANVTVAAGVLTVASRNTSSGTVEVSGSAASALNLAAGPAQSITASAAFASNLFAKSAGLFNKTFICAADGGDNVTVTLELKDVLDMNALKTKLTDSIKDLKVSVAGNVVTLTSKYCGPGASVQVSSTSTGVGSTLINITTTKTTSADASHIPGVLGSVVTGLGASNAEIVATNKLKVKSTMTGSLSKVVLSESEKDTLKNLGMTVTSAAGIDKKAPQDITAEDLVALFSTAPEAKDAVTFTAEDGQVVITCSYEGPGSFIEIKTPVTQPHNGDNMKTALQFMGDYRGESDQDHVQELPGVDDHNTGVLVRGLDDFDKMNTEVQKMPDDLAVVFRPITIIGKNAVGMVSKAVNVFKASVKVGGIKLPTAKGSIGLIANKGISLGTPDRIVGAGGQGIVFIADGGTGNPDHAKYVLFEDAFNKFMGADLFARWEPPKDKPSLGFRVFSDTTVDLTARNTANLLALGRTKVGAEVIGNGIARVAGSYAVELAAREKVVIGARDKKIGRVEVLGTTVALGYTKIDIDDQPFGLTKRGPSLGWPAETKDPANKVELAKEHALTSSVLIHSTEQACIVVGPYMVQLRSKKGQEEAALVTKARVQAAQDRVDQANEDVDNLNDVLTLFMDDQELLDHNKQLDTANNALQEAQTELANAQAADGLANSIIGEGVFITMREPDAKKNSAVTNIPHKGKPGIYMNSDGVTITMKYGEDDGDDTARITLKDSKLEVRLGQKAGLQITKNNVRLQDGDGNMAKFEGGRFKVDASREIAFGKASKIMLG